MASIISYLENYVESTLGLPSDLSRFLNMIRVLDARTAELMEAIKHTTDALCRMEPAAGSRKGGPDEQEYLGLVASFKRQEALLYQFSEEKVTLAQHALELITNHQRELDATTAQFEEEVAAIPTAAADAYNPFEQPYSAGGGRGKGKGFADQWDSLEPLAAPSLKRIPVGPSAGGGPMGGAGIPPHIPTTKKRVREDQRVMAAAVLAQGDEFGGMGGFGGGGSSNPSSMAAGGDSMYPTLQFAHHERTLGLMDSAQQPQLPGRLLQVSDIKPDLQGRQAEMFWPDDNMWYLIEIHRVNVIDKTATIVYRTGEVEELNLQEIANEGHMSLIEPL
ncbi:hypothetical protein OEZ85_013370 [Tetradesmus obliquus]|uniref:Inhibitor of growth protein N-terminal histone-binding domain-containing protein n=1 Tax=Tetradesmus obliquus TaxID=3088 RepID=A0ABY8U679_TETOB|nr:hypothetical protein OEZ85_013370 [Tetradesmus obliquus]